MTLENQTDAPLPVLPPREPDSHKGDFGRALVVGGSRGMSGAIAMTGLATLRSGAGLVTLAVPRSIQDLVASFSPCFMTYTLNEEEGQIALSAAEQVVAFANNATALALGPGIGRGPELTSLVKQLHHQIKQPIVIDADALSALAEDPQALSSNVSPRVLTPHPGEFARLDGKPYDRTERVIAAAALARRDTTGNTIVVLKGYRTVITDGKRYSLNSTGNPGMATGGSGDVLTGIITALLCQRLEPFDAARLGVHLHGLAGDLAALELGQVSLIATDLIDYLPQAFQAVVG